MTSSTDSTRHSSGSHKHCELNWWDLWPLVDNDKRPLQWTSESLILSPHPAPAVCARLFPSSYTFLLPSPPVVASTPNAYLPPTLIEASPSLDYIFAYFPSKTADTHSACVWSRGETLDSWKLDTCWIAKRGYGFVLAKWLGRERAWLPGNPPVRGCASGPTNPFASSRLLIVTENHAIQFVDRISPFPGFQLASASLLHASRCNAAEKVPLKEMVNGPGGVTVCTKATIGLGYNEDTLIIATQSSLIASSTHFDFPDFATMNQPPVASPSTASSWDTFGTENVIRLCEVKLLINRFQVGVETKPLPPLVPKLNSFAYLTDMFIVPVCPVHRGQTTGGPENEPGMYVTLVYADMEDYSSPKSHLLSYRLKRKEPQQSRPKRSDWTCSFVARKTLTDSVVTFLTPSKRDETGVVFAGLVDLQGIKPTENRGNQQAVIGKIAALKLPSFDNDPRWEPSTLVGLPNEAGSCLSMSAALSPNETLLCTTNSYWDYSPKFGIYPIVHMNTPSGVTGAAHPVEEILAASIISVRSNADILHVLTGPNIKDEDALRTLFDCLHIIKSQTSVSRDVDYDIIKAVIPLFRERGQLSSKKGSRSLYERSEVALDICSIRAITNAFGSCKEEVGYDMEPVWNLLALFLWFIDYLARVLRDLILLEGYLAVSGDLKKLASFVLEETDEPTDDDLGSHLVPPLLIHLVHPYALHNLINALSHFNAFREYMDTLTASKLRSNLAKEVFVDAQDNSGINLKELESELRKIPQMEEFKSLDETVFQKSLCAMQPIPDTYPLLAEICRQILRSGSVSKSRIFIEANEVVIGVNKPAPSSLKSDIISKANLHLPNSVRMCAVCKGKTEVGQVAFPKGRDVTYSSWALWEHDWNRCVCGGTWIKPMKL